MEKRFGNLIIRHRKSAIFFEREGNTENTELYAPYLQWGDGKETIRGEPIPFFKRAELDRRYDYSLDEARAIFQYLQSIATEAWPNFEIKPADSIGADYDSYWDKDFLDEGNLSFGTKDFFIFSAPHQPLSKDGIIRLYKFNKRKFESFMFDFQKRITN